MTPVFIGTARESLGFALAGVASYVCDSRAEVESCVNRAVQEIADPVILLSKSAADLIAETCEQWRRSGSGPMFVALPE